MAFMRVDEGINMSKDDLLPAAQETPQDEATTGQAAGVQCSGSKISYVESLNLSNEAKLAPPEELQKRARRNSKAERKRVYSTVNAMLDHYRGQPV